MFADVIVESYFYQEGMRTLLIINISLKKIASVNQNNLDIISRKDSKLDGKNSQNYR